MKIWMLLLWSAVVAVVAGCAGEVRPVADVATGTVSPAPTEAPAVPEPPPREVAAAVSPGTAVLVPADGDEGLPPVAAEASLVTPSVTVTVTAAGEWDLGPPDGGRVALAWLVRLSAPPLLAPDASDSLFGDGDDLPPRDASTTLWLDTGSSRLPVTAPGGDDPTVARCDELPCRGPDPGTFVLVAGVDAGARPVLVATVDGADQRLDLRNGEVTSEVSRVAYGRHGADSGNGAGADADDGSGANADDGSGAGADSGNGAGADADDGSGTNADDGSGAGADDGSGADAGAGVGAVPVAAPAWPQRSLSVRSEAQLEAEFGSGAGDLTRGGLEVGYGGRVTEAFLAPFDRIEGWAPPGHAWLVLRVEDTFRQPGLTAWRAELDAAASWTLAHDAGVAMVAHPPSPSDVLAFLIPDDVRSVTLAYQPVGTVGLPPDAHYEFQAPEPLTVEIALS